MKTSNFLSIIILILFFSFNFTACQNSSDADNSNKDSLNIDSEIIDTVQINQSETIEEDNDYVAKYICPMHCEGSGNDKAGNCKVCGMELIENLDHEEN